MNIGIIADDLTSAGDSILPFYNKGASCEIVMNSYQTKTSNVMALNVNTRNLSAEDAYLKTYQEVSKLSLQDILIKTIDSTLRGNIKLELGAAFMASKRETVVICPAFPDAGRTTVNGLQFVNGVLVAESRYSNDPVHPCLTSCISDLVAPELGKKINLSSNVCSKEIEQATRNFNVLILDAEDQDSLNKVVNMIQNPEHILWVGSPGISYALAKRFTFNNNFNRPSVTNKRVFIAIGSTNQISVLQKDSLTCKVYSTDEKFDYKAKYPKFLAISSPTKISQPPDVILQKISIMAATIIRKGKYDLFIATGGQTAAAILEQLEIKVFDIVGEIEAGFPICVVRKGETHEGLFFGIKAGGFGDKNSLNKALDKFKKTYNYKALKL